MSEPIHVAALVLRNVEGQVLTVRKRGTTRFMFPGGKPEPGEDIRDTALRETVEEIGVTLNPLQLRYLGTWSTDAANEDGRLVRATVFSHPVIAVGEPMAEIDAVRWVDVSDRADDLAPLLREAVLPALDDRVRRLQRLTVFTGSSSGNETLFTDAATTFGRTLAGAGVGVVYGGGHVGLMGAVAEAALAAGGEVIGVMPEVLVDREIAHHALGRLETVPDMHARKLRMAVLGDGFVALPGGIGTLEEVVEAWTWLQLGTHAKPVALLDVDGYWQPFLAMADAMVDRGFLASTSRDALVVADDPTDLLDRLSRWQPPSTTWLEPATSARVVGP